MQKISGKVLIVVFVGVLVVVGLGYGGYRLFSKEKPKENGNTNQATQSATTEYTWKTYQNEQYGFSFEYPDYWTEEQINENLQEKRQDLYLNKKDVGCFGYSKCGKYIFLFISNASNIGESIDIWYTKLETENGFGPDEILEKEKTDIAGKKAWKLKVGYEPGVIGSTYLIFNFEKGYVFGLDMSFEPLTDTEKDITQHILNTLHFDN